GMGVGRKILQRLEGQSRCRDAARRQPRHDAPIDGMVDAVDHGAAGLGDGGIKQVGADRGSRMDANRRTRIGVIRDPPPTPVIPTRTPTARPARIKSGPCPWTAPIDLTPLVADSASALFRVASLL